MKKHPLLRTALLVMTAAALLCVSALAVEDGAPANSMYGTFWALVPPVIAITLALITKEAYSSLFIGVTVGALFSQGFSPIGALNMIVNDGLVAAIKDNAGIFLFLVLLGIIVALVNAAGGSAAFGRWASQNIKTKVGASLATFLLGILIFIDDYFNCLTVGTVMRPVTDSHRISRPKLAYLIDATAAPVCMIAPISSWAAAVSSTAEGLDTGISGIQLFIKAIPYNLYSLLTFVFIIALSFMQFDYGPMRAYERKAQETGDLSALENAEDEAVNPKGKVIDLLLPVLVLIAVCTTGMIYVGGFFGVDAWGGTDCAGDFIGAFGNTDAFMGLPWGGIIALLFTVIYLVARRVITFKDAMACIPKGFNAMISPILILTLAVSLKAVSYTHLIQEICDKFQQIVYSIFIGWAAQKKRQLQKRSLLYVLAPLVAVGGVLPVSYTHLCRKRAWTKSMCGLTGINAWTPRTAMRRCALTAWRLSLIHIFIS